MTKKTAFVAMPSYGLISAGAARGMYRATDYKLNVIGEDFESSLLAQCFNVFWAGALNACRTGRKIDYFAMIHSDVIPEDFWLDRLIEELDAHNLDVISTAIPIKSTKGLTSCGFEAEPFNEWRIGGRITMAELHRLPPTFTAEHVGRPLVMNTGLWACRFNPDWASKVAFTIRDRIAVQPDGSYLAEVMSEDWDFSRQIRGLGLKLGITRRVKAVHRGNAGYPNNTVWGTHAYDSDLLTEPLIP